VAPILLIFLRIKLTTVYNSEIRYTKKLCIFLTGGVYTPYSPCMSAPLLSTVLPVYLIVIFSTHLRRTNTWQHPS